MKKVLFSLMLVAAISSCSEDEKVTPTLEVSVKQIEVPATEKVTDVSITSNGSWTAVSAATEWCTVAPASGANAGTIQITALANPTMEERTTTVTVKSETLEKKIDVKQAGASLSAVLAGSWTLIDQTSGDVGYDDLKGVTFDLKADGKVLVILNLDLPGVGVIDKIEGTWKADDNVITINGTFLGSPTTVTLKIVQREDDMMMCTLSGLAPLLPPNGIPVLFEKK